MADNQKVIELLEHEGQWHDDNGRTFALVHWPNYKQALALLKPCPVQGDCDKMLIGCQSQEIGV